MSVLDNIFREEAERINRMLKAYSKELESLPKGSVVVKKINNNKYYYRQFREGEKIKSIYIDPESVDRIREEIKRRKSLEQAVRRAKLDLHKLKKVTK